ncbi:penicillin-binding protein 1A [Coralloluteibacterium thermophilus]|uniref:Penicillin-binding protein 1A n=1 Tax=Coralloluteibacterium thermophilum TaxID=2707049 RepID=A0ABV9NS91_9GAMM
MSRLVRWLRLALYAGLALLLAGILALAVAYWLISPRIPDVQALREVELQVPMSVYARDGELIAVFGEFRRYPVRIGDVPEQVKQAFIAIEDARFYEHQGLDWRGIGRAIWLLATTDDARVPGGSTITQQVARQFFLSSEYSYSRKLMEMLTALKMERELTKDEIFELYLNKGFFGNRAYGVAAAAEFYYGKRLDELTLGQAAVLASIPKFPSSGNPITNPERALIRRNYVLVRMHELGFIDRAAMTAAQAEPMDAEPHEPPVQVEAPYVAEMVRQAMVDRYGGDVLNQGMHVYTTIDAKAQNAANLAVRGGLLDYDRRHGWRGAEDRVELPEGEDDPAVLRAHLRGAVSVGGLLPALVLESGASSARVMLANGREVELGSDAVRWTRRAPRQLFTRGDIIRLQPGGDADSYVLAQVPKAQAALVSLRPEDGALHALVGGFSFAANKFNRVTQAQRQPGSAFKPFVYAAAFERGFTPASIVLDAPVVFNDRWTGRVWSPQNDDGQFRGPMRLREALVQSRNLVSVRVLDALGVDFTRQYVARFGFPEQGLPPNLTMALGTTSVPPLTVARGYSVFANGGFLVDPWFIERIYDRDGVLIARTHPAVACRDCFERRVLETSTSTIVDGFDLGPAGGGMSFGGEVDGFDLGAAPRPATADVAEAQETMPAAPALPPITEEDRRAAAEFVGPPYVQLAPRAIDERTAFQVTSLMHDVVQRGTGTAARVLERPDIGGKTGSTNEHRDAWFSGFGADLVTTVWVGMDDFTTLGFREYGGRAALPIWIDYMRVALDGRPVEDERVPQGLVPTYVDRGSGYPVGAGTPGALREFFKTEDLERLATRGYDSYPSTSEQEAFDIF